MRAAIFIDAGYLLKQVQDQRISIDYKSLAEFLLKPLRNLTQVDLMRCYFYYCPPYMSQTPTIDELRRMQVHESFVAELESIPRWAFREGKLEKRREGDRDVFSQKRVDVKLSVDLVRHAAAGHIQHAIIVAGDSDFIPAIKAAMEEGVTISLACGNDRSVHRDLIKLVDEVRFVDWKEAKVNSGGRQNSESSSAQRASGTRKKASRKKSSSKSPITSESSSQSSSNPKPSSGDGTTRKSSTRKKASKVRKKATSTKKRT